MRYILRGWSYYDAQVDLCTTDREWWCLYASRTGANVSLSLSL